MAVAPIAIQSKNLSSATVPQSSAAGRCGGDEPVGAMIELLVNTAVSISLGKLKIRKGRGADGMQLEGAAIRN